MNETFPHTEMTKSTYGGGCEVLSDLLKFVIAEKSLAFVI